MSKPSMARFLKRMEETLAKHSPEILTGIGISGMITTTVLAVKATPKALALLEDARYEKGSALKPVEKVKIAWKPYVPAVVTATASIACLVGANSVHTRRTTALAAAYQLSETALAEYREKVVETLGEKKERAVRETISQERVEKQPVSKSEVYITNTGDTLFMDPLSKRYFKSDIELIRRAENNLNKQMLQDITGYVSLNDFYSELGLDYTDVGFDLGWNVDKLIDLDFHATQADDGRPCLAIDYHVPPRYKFDCL